MSAYVVKFMTKKCIIRNDQNVYFLKQVFYVYCVLAVLLIIADQSHVSRVYLYVCNYGFLGFRSCHSCASHSSLSLSVSLSLSLFLLVSRPRKRDTDALLLVKILLDAPQQEETGLSSFPQTNIRLLLF